MEKNKALSKCMQMCSKKEYCITDIRTKLETWELPPDDIDEIIARLIEEKFLDEKRYVQAFVNDKFRFNKWGRNKIKYMLKQKYVPRSLIIEGLQTINQNDYMELLKQLVNDKKRKVTGNSDYERNGKVVNYLVSRGFETDLIFKFVNSDFDE